MPRWLWSAAGTVALVAGAWWTLLFLMQRQMMFPRPAVLGSPSRPADARQVWLDVAGHRVEAWLLPPLAQAPPPHPVLLYAHGNAELIDYWPPGFDEPRRWGYAVLLVEYPGYGRSGGAPSRASVRATMLAAHDWVGAEPGLDPARIVGLGRSLGGGAMAELSRERRLAALILESTFTSVADLARGMLAPPFLVRDPFDPRAALAQFDGPVLILHGMRDEVIPVRHARGLHDAAPTARLELLPCGHNDCVRPWPVVREFLDGHGLLPVRASGGAASGR